MCQARQRLGTEPLFWGSGSWPALYLLPCFEGRARSPRRSAHVPSSRGVPPRAAAASRRPEAVPGVLSRLLCGAAGARGEQGWASGVSARASGLAPGGCSAPQATPTSWWACRVTPRSPARFWRLELYLLFVCFAFASVLGEGVCWARLLSVQTTTSFADFRVTYS